MNRLREHQHTAGDVSWRLRPHRVQSATMQLEALSFGGPGGGGVHATAGLVVWGDGVPAHHTWLCTPGPLPPVPCSLMKRQPHKCGGGGGEGLLI